VLELANELAIDDQHREQIDAERRSFENPRSDRDFNATAFYNLVGIAMYLCALHEIGMTCPDSDCTPPPSPARSV
jgi:hypothetical protein